MKIAILGREYGVEVSDASAYEGYRPTEGGRERAINDSNMLGFEITMDPPPGGNKWVEVTLELARLRLRPTSMAVSVSADGRSGSGRCSLCGAKPRS